MRGFLVGLFALPLLGGTLIVLALRRPPSFPLARHVTLAATGLTALCALALLPRSGESPTLAIEWLPGAGTMTIGLGATGLYAVVATSWSAFLAWLEAAWYGEELPPLTGAVTLLALAAANVAFLAEHFLARYAALEIVALCVALAPLIELGRAAGGRFARFVYLILRLGDTGLLAAIMILAAASGTLEIAPALQAGTALDAAHLGWVVVGLALAVWVKLGGWPMHLWSLAGRRLSLATHAWLYATLLPNLGAYLLYRVTPLLALSAPLQVALLWLGAAGAALAALLTLIQADLRTALVYVGAAQGGLALFAAASGLKTAVWVGLLVTTPLRLLLFLAAGAVRRPGAPSRRRAAAGLFAVGGLALAAFGLLVAWWAWESDVRLATLVLALVAIALSGIWAARTGRRLWSQPAPRDVRKPPSATGASDLEEGLVRLAEAMHAVIEVGILERAVAWIVQIVVGGAHLVYDLVERRMLGGLPQWTAQAAAGGGVVIYRVVEEEGLEGLLHRAVRAVLALSRSLQRWHTGRLRRNLLWVPLLLVLVLIAMLVGW